jgi:hypothetical protein
MPIQAQDKEVLSVSPKRQYLSKNLPVPLSIKQNEGM